MAARLSGSSNDAFPPGVNDDQATERDLRGPLHHDESEKSKKYYVYSMVSRKNAGRRAGESFPLDPLGKRS